MISTTKIKNPTTFVEMLNQSLEHVNLRPGTIVKGTVLKVANDYVLINAGLKSEGAVPIQQFRNAEGELEVKVGDEVDVALDAIEDGIGETRLSREKAKRAEAWNMLAKAFETQATVRGFVSGKVKGGFTVEINTVRAFLPGSLVDVRPLRESANIEGREFDFKVIKIDQKRNNVVVSRRSVLESENSAEREALISTLQEGQEVRGVVKNLADYGAFIDLGGIDGLLHITDISWARVRHPSEVLSVGDELMVKVLKIDREKQRVSLGRKQLGSDPWSAIKARYPEGSKLTGKVTNITDYGCFVEIEDGVEGLVHVSEIDWTNKNIHPSKIVQLGQEVQVVVLDIDEERRRISLGIKQCQENPWGKFSSEHKKGEHVTGKIRSITDFGIFIGLEGNIDGLIHLSDIDWNLSGEEAMRNYKKGQEIEAVILSIDPERERISLGLKQLQQDPFANYLATHPKGSIVTGVVREVDAKSAIIDLAEGIEGTIRANEIDRNKVEDVRHLLQVGQTIEAKFMAVDRKTRSIQLSIKAKDVQEEKQALKNFKRTNDQGGITSSLGDLLKEQMDGQAKDEDES